MNLTGDIGGGRLLSIEEPSGISGEMDRVEVSACLSSLRIFGITKIKGVSADLERVIRKGSGIIDMPDIDHVIPIDRADYVALESKDAHTLYLIRG